nr:hypothetical protein [bacterium]
MFQFAPISEKTQGLLNRRLNANKGNVYMDAERTKIYTDYYKAHEAEPTDLKRAHCLLEWASKKTIRVEEDDIFVGNLGKTYRSLMCFMEWGSGWMYDATHGDDEMFVKAWQTPGCFARMTDEDREIFAEASEYWLDKSIQARVEACVPPEMRYYCYGDGCDDMWMRRDKLSFMPQGHVSPNFQKVISKGFGAIKKECEERMAGLLGKTFGNDAAKYNFYRSTAIVCDAAITLSKRYGAECRVMAEKVPERKEEFLKMADSLEWIMENPCRNTWEALQAVELYEMMLIVDGIQHGLTLGRIDQYAGWFAKEELEAGTMTVEELQTLADAFILKLQDNIAVMSMGGNDMLSKLSTRPDVEHAYFTNGQHYTVGGVNAAGEDVTNPLTLAFLQCCGRLALADPSASVRVHKGTPDEVWQVAIEASKINGGVPTIESDDCIIPALMRRGVSLEDARCYCIIGCVEPTVGGMECCACGGTGTESMFNLVGCMVTAINNGCNPTTGYDRGPKTGYLYEHENFESFQKAFIEQLHYYLDWQVTECNFYELVYALHFPNVATSATMDGCMEKGMDVEHGGAKYNSTGMTGCGIGNIADSLITIKMAFDGRLGVTPKELYDALAANWEGYEDLQQRIENELPHYGNNIAEVDDLAAWAMEEFCDHMAECTGPRGHYVAGTFTMTVHLDYGSKTWATPDGRYKGDPLADAISPRQGFDKNGPTAYLLSAAKLPHTKIGNGDQLNIKFTPTAVAGDEGTIKMRELFQAYFDQGGMQVQFNVVGLDTLYDAQEHPEDHKNLIVRIAGFSAYFVEMPKVMQ